MSYCKHNIVVNHSTFNAATIKYAPKIILRQTAKDYELIIIGTSNYGSGKFCRSRLEIKLDRICKMIYYDAQNILN